MIILSIRTDRPEAEIGLYNDTKQLAYEAWLGHRQLAEALHAKIGLLLQTQQMNWQNLQGIVCFQGPGSFTGLRIGISVGNALAYSYDLPIVATQDPAWLETAINQLLAGTNHRQAQPFYGADANITPPKK
ncbi:MAG TPA: hypothetical protein VLE99_03790 [Candidatus Saccharimonadales bacterium]|nr:hypothetical protein [Candidatus Saccharimonadales bacterium]